MSRQIRNAGVPMPHVDGITHRWVDVRGERFHVAQSEPTDPAAPVVVLLHGWPQHWWCWRKVMPELMLDARVVAVDLRGHGWSSAPKDRYLKEELVDDLFAVLDDLGHPRVRLVGSADPVANGAFLDGWQDHAADMTVECIDGVGHFIPEESPARVIRAINALGR